VRASAALASERSSASEHHTHAATSTFRMGTPGVGGACEHLCSSFCVTLRGEQQWQHAVRRLAAQPHHPWTHSAEVDRYASFDLCSHPHAVVGYPPLGTGIGVRSTVAVMKQ